MAEVVAASLIDEIVERETVARSLCDKSDPFQIDSNKFLKQFRVSKDLARYLIEELKDELESERLSPAIRVLTALGFYASGGYQTNVGIEMNVSQPTVCRSIDLVTTAINKELLRKTIKFPTFEEQQIIKRRFFEKHGIPGVIGAIDCTHIAMIKPADNNTFYRDIAYMNRKGFYSLNVQLVADDNLKIRGICAKYPGSVHDSFIWRNSAVRRQLIHMHSQQNSNAWLLGDSGYPLEPWLLTPFPEPDEGSVEDYYNSKHASARNCIERVNGVLKSRFRCLSKHRVLNY